MKSSSNHRTTSRRGQGGRGTYAGAVAGATILAAMATAACGSAQGSPPSTGRIEVVESAGIVGMLRPEAPVTLAPGQAVAVAGSALIVRFERVIEDSRCPRGTTCVWAGRARVELAARTSPSGPDREIEIEIGSPEKGFFELAGKRVVAEALEPAPKGDSQITPGAYRLRLSTPATKPPNGGRSSGGRGTSSGAARPDRDR
jgi:hypothetical protein